MKLYIRASQISNDIINQAIYHAESSGDSRGTIIDIPNRKIVLVFGAGVDEDGLFDPEIGLGTWFTNNGFNVETEVKDVEYVTKGTLNTRAMRREGAGNKRVLRNRLVMTITW